MKQSATSLGVTWPGRDGSQSLLVRQRVGSGSLRLFGALGVGYSQRPDLLSVPPTLIARASLINTGLEAVSGAFSGTVTLQRATTDDWQLMEASGIVLKRTVPSYELHDAVLDVTWRGARASVSASRSWRTGFGETRGTSNGYGLSAAWRAARSLVLIAHGGKQMADPLRGVPQATYAGVLARWQWSRTPRATTVRSARDIEYVLSPDTGGGELLLQVQAPPDAIVEVASSANDWSPIRAVAQGDRFVLRLRLPSGTHRVAVRVNGGAWRAPRGLVRVDDDFGGASGIVVIPNE